LQHNLLDAHRRGVHRIISFGGAWSNHIHALACAGNRFGFETIGIIRGESEYANNPTLSDARTWGMRLEFVTRAEYRRRSDEAYHQELLARWPGSVIVPEGGSNALALDGVAGLVRQIEQQDCQPDYLITACGTGGTLAGLVAAAPRHWRVLGVAALKGAGFLYRDVQALLEAAKVCPQAYWGIDLEGHEGGYARTSGALVQFISRFEQQHQIPLEHVYTAKMLFRLEQLIERGAFCPGSRILALHTGGLQGRRGLLEG